MPQRLRKTPYVPMIQVSLCLRSAASLACIRRAMRGRTQPAHKFDKLLGALAGKKGSGAKRILFARLPSRKWADLAVYHEPRGTASFSKCRVDGGFGYDPVFYFRHSTRHCGTLERGKNLHSLAERHFGGC